VTEAEWLACTDPEKMLRLLYPGLSARKFRLTQCAFLRHLWHLLTDVRSRQAVAVAERVADGATSEQQRTAAHADALAAFVAARDDRYSGRHPLFYLGPVAAADYAASSCEADLRAYIPPGRAECFSRLELMYLAALPDGPGLEGLEARRERAAQAEVLRDLFGNPFRPVTVSPACVTPQVAALAQAAYEHRDLPSGHLDPSRLAVLADALEDAGCDQADLLGHLRGPGPHVRGCWAVDLLLGKQ
jgi:hypothetical protein